MYLCYYLQRYSKQPDTASTEQKANTGGLQTVVMASTGSDADIWRYIATFT